MSTVEEGFPIGEVAAIEATESLHAGCDERLARTNQERDDHYQRANRLFAEFQSFRERVRGVAVQAHRDGYFCRDGLNERLEELELEPYAPRWVVRMNVSLELTVQADDEAEAEGAAVEALMVTYDEDTALDMDQLEVTVRSVTEDE